MVAVGEVFSIYVGQKISKVRWSPVPQGDLGSSNVFTSGGWDDKLNKLSVWTLQEELHQVSEKGRSSLSSEPYLLDEIDHIGSVTDLQYIDCERLVSSSSVGDVSVYRFSTRNKNLSLVHQWKSIHHFPSGKCPCTCIATSKTMPDIITGGEDGRLNVLRVDERHPLRTIGNADSTTINAVSYLNSYEIITVNSIGQLKVWDLRRQSDKPTRILSLTGEHISVLCVDKHPTQSHVVATGGQNGVLSIWDMRQEHYPVTLIEAHDSEMWEVKFHPRSPDNLFTCSEDGSVWQWDGSQMREAPPINMDTGYPGNIVQEIEHTITSPWLSVESKNKIENYSLLPMNRLPVNSLDIESQHLICGTDGEALFVIQDLAIK